MIVPRRKKLKLIICIIICFSFIQYCVIIAYDVFFETMPVHRGSQQKGKSIFSKIFMTGQTQFWSGVQDHIDSSIASLFQYFSKLWNRLIRVSEDEYYTPRTRQVSDVEFPFLDNGTHVCYDAKGPPLAVILILSTWDFPTRRQAVRDTWASGNYPCPVLGKPRQNGAAQSPSGDSLRRAYTARNETNTWKNLVRHVFIIAMPREATRRQIVMTALQRESRQHRDIVVVDFVEAYNNLTTKVLAGLRWAVHFCHRAQYVVKTDEDVFIHVPRLMDILTRPGNRGVIVGGLSRGKGDLVFRTGRYAIPYQAYPFDDGFPVHVKGGVYAMDVPIARAIIQVAPYMPYITVEDVYITGILRRVAGAKAKRLPRGAYSDTAFVLNSELQQYVRGKRIASHSLKKAANMHWLWREVTKAAVC